MTIAALVEISLGFMILVCLQERLLALFISFLFVLTTMVFGRAELVGHTMIHTILIVFLFAGPGKATPPLHWIGSMKIRIPATAVAFVALTGMLMIPYAFGSSLIYQSNASSRREKKMPVDMHDTLIDAGPSVEAPRLAITPHKDPVNGWNLELVTSNFKFAPASAGLDHVPGEGHAHLMINGKKVARVYHQWHHIPDLPQGKHELVVTLNANNHAGLAVDGVAIEASTTIDVLD